MSYDTQPNSGDFLLLFINELRVSMDFLFQDSLFEPDCGSLNFDALGETDKNFVVKTVKNLKAYRNELNGSD